MKTGVFVEGLSNEQRFHAAIKTVENRGAPESSWLLVEGDPGFGKSKLLFRHAMQKSCIFVRAKADWTPNWLLRDLCAQIGITPSARTEAMSNNVAAELCKNQPTIIIDEIDHAARSLRVLETIRDLTDTSEVMLIAGGMKGCFATMKRYPQIRSRISEVVPFAPASADDIKVIAEKLTEIRLADDLVAIIQRETNGQLRAVMNALARIEARMRNTREKITAAMWNGKPLLADHQNLIRVVANNG